MPTPVETLNLSFPPLPQTLLKAIELTHEPDGPAPEDVSLMVERDPAAAARLLRVANSAYYGQDGRIQDVQRAVTVLGAAPVVGLVMSMGIAELRDALDAQTAGPFLNLIRHSIATGYLARHLVQRAPAGLSAGTGGEAFAAGLLHDIGKLALLYNFPQKATALYTHESESAEALRREEAALFGSDHLQTGLHFANRFRLPASLRQVMAGHQGAEGDTDATVLLYAVTAANKAANAMDYAFNQFSARIDLGTDPIWERMMEAQHLGYTSIDEMLSTLSEAEEGLASYVGAVL